MTDIRQSPEYAQYIKSLGWQVEKLEKWNIFIKKFPLIGSLIKIQRLEPPIPFAEIENLAKKHRAFQIVIEPSPTQHPRFAREARRAQTPKNPHGYRPLKSPFIPTKTLVLDLKKSEKEIFGSFSRNKRRDIRITERNRLVIKEGSQEEFLNLKKQFLLRRKILPLGTKKEIFNLIESFGSEKSKILIVIARNEATKQSYPIAGLLLLFYDKTAYYWQAASTPLGNKLLAPTLLLWEAIKVAKEKGYEIFDFEGVYDERFPQNKSWLGFTKFKEGFGGKEVLYPEPITKIKFPLSVII